MKKTLLALFGLMLTLAVSAQTKVSQATTWNFADKQNGEVLADKIVDMNGLYLRGGADKHSINAKKVGCKLQLSDGTNYSAKMAAGCSGGMFWKNIKATSKADQIFSKGDMCYAMEIAVPGTLQIIANPKGGLEGKGRMAKLFFNGQEVYNRSFDEKGAFEVLYKADKPGTFFFGANGAMFVYQVKFTPAQ